MPDRTKPSTGSLRLSLRIPRNSSDPRHQAFWEWYDLLPTTEGGRKAGLQERVMDLLGESLGVQAPFSPPGARQHPSGASKPDTGSQKPSRKKTSSKKAGASTKNKPQQADKEPSGAAAEALKSFDL